MLEHPGEELIYLLDGTLEFDVGGTEYVLTPATRCTSAPCSRTRGATPPA